MGQKVHGRQLSTSVEQLDERQHKHLGFYGRVMIRDESREQWRKLLAQ
jgi:hypothetical protein